MLANASVKPPCQYKLFFGVVVCAGQNFVEKSEISLFSLGLKKKNHIAQIFHANLDGPPKSRAKRPMKPIPTVQQIFEALNIRGGRQLLIRDSFL